MKRRVSRVYHQALRPAWLRLRHGPAWLAARCLGREQAVPPPWLMFVGGGDFLAVGREFRGHFITLAGLRPHEQVLDVGCGVGRMALALTEYLAPPGSYRGFDVNPAGIRWCERHITPKFPNFRFQTVDVANRHYRPRGRDQARTFRFPYAEDSFDFVFLTSVFTHLLPADAAHYLGEIARVLRPGGRVLMTFFLLTPDSRLAIAQGRSSQPLRHEVDGCLSVDPEDPERSLAHDQDWLRATCAARGLAMRPPHYGNWCGREDHVSYQDIVVADRV